MMSPYSALLCTLVVLSPFTGCSKDNAARALPPNGKAEDSSGGDVVSLGIARLTYRPAAAAASGAIVGRVSIAGTAADSAAPSRTPMSPRPSRSTPAAMCDSNAAMPTSGGVSNALVWIEGMSTGKPLPEVRRETLNVDHCGVEPQLLAVVSPTTINVFSRDKDTHYTRFYRSGSGVVDSVRTVDEGEVVPSERIAAVPGIVEVRDATHPGIRGYVAAFSHPYFAVTDASGAFRIDGLQPGTYTIKIWHADLPAPVQQRVVVGAGGTGHVDAQLALP
jgi:hypothetical protein